MHYTRAVYVHLCTCALQQAVCMHYTRAVYIFICALPQALCMHNTRAVYVHMCITTGSMHALHQSVYLHYTRHYACITPGSINALYQAEGQAEGMHYQAEGMHCQAEGMHYARHYTCIKSAQSSTTTTSIRNVGQVSAQPSPYSATTAATSSLCAVSLLPVEAQCQSVSL